jgi:hypothetical protein
MLSELCQELKNWFDRGQPKIHGAFEISEGKIVDTDFTDVIKYNQYFRIIGSVFNDGVYEYTEGLVLIDEMFVGSIWLMAIPPDIILLNKDIDQWIANYGEVVNSPYSSESFGGYSYSKSSGRSENSGLSGPTWQSTFASRLNMYRRISAL